MYSVFEYYSNNILFVFVFGHNSEPEYYSYSYSAKYLCTNIIRIRIRSFWKNEYYSYSYSVKILIPNNISIRIRSKKQYSLTSVLCTCMEGLFSELIFFAAFVQQTYICLYIMELTVPHKTGRNWQKQSTRGKYLLGWWKYWEIR